jgi:cytochrome c553
MLKNRFSTIAGAVAFFAIVAVPANAQDAVEAKVQTCGACHGQNGVPLDPKTMPIIWGQQESYLVKQLHDFRAGDRDSPIMSAMAKGIAQEDLRKVAAYFAAKPWPPEPAAAAPAPAAPPEEKIAVCKACHQPKFEGGPPAPRLAGLSYEYLLAQMNNFADGKRTNNLDMPKLMQALTPADRDQIAHYLSAL